MKIAIIGSGAAAMGVIDALSQLNISNLSVAIYDNGKNIPSFPHQAMIDSKKIYDDLYKKNKTNFGLHFPPAKTTFGEGLDHYFINGKKAFLKNHYFGGLTNFWGGTMLPFSDFDFNEWPINKEDLYEHYTAIKKSVGISGETDRLSDFYGLEFSNLPPIRTLPNFRRLMKTINKNNEIASINKTYNFFAGVNRVAVETRSEKSNSCTYCGECMAGCYRSSIFSAAEYIISSKIKKLKIRIHRKKILKIDHTHSELLMEGGVKSNPFDLIFLGAGCVGTSEIALRSFMPKEKLKMVDNAIFQFPIIDLDPLKFTFSDKYFSLSNLIVSCRNNEGNSAQIQIYPNFDYLWRNAIPEIAFKMIKGALNLFRDKILWARLYTHSDFGYSYILHLDSKEKLKYYRDRKPSIEEYRSFLSPFTKTLRKSPFFIPPFPVMMAKSSSHYAGPLSYGKKPFNLQSNGEISEGIYIVDSSCFPNSPATSLTFTIMANARRTTIGAIKKFSRKNKIN